MRRIFLADLEHTQGWRLLGIAILMAWTSSLFLPVGAGVKGWQILDYWYFAIYIREWGILANASVFIGATLLAARVKPSHWLTFSLAVFTAVTVTYAALWSGDLPSDDHKTNIFPAGSGYYIWFAAVTIAGIAPLIRSFRSRTR